MKDESPNPVGRKDLDASFDQFSRELDKLKNEPWKGLTYHQDTGNDYRVRDQRVPCNCGAKAAWGDYLCRACRG